MLFFVVDMRFASVAIPARVASMITPAETVLNIVRRSLLTASGVTSCRAINLYTIGDIMAVADAEVTKESNPITGTGIALRSVV